MPLISIDQDFNVSCGSDIVVDVGMTIFLCALRICARSRDLVILGFLRRHRVEQLSRRECSRIARRASEK